MKSRPFPAQQAEPERRLDALLHYLRSQSDPELGRWFLESLSDGLGRAVVIGAEDTVDDADAFFQAALTAYYLAGQERKNHGRLLHLMGQVIQDLREQLQMWKMEGPRVKNWPN